MIVDSTDQETIECAKKLIIQQGLLGNSGQERSFLADESCCQKISSDGSTRRFWRVKNSCGPNCIVVLPGGNSDQELSESRSAWKIGSQLWRKNVAVPEVYGWDKNSGMLLFEDLGDLRLHDLVKQTEGKDDPSSIIEDLYVTVIEKLVTMQVKGCEDFLEDWCWDGSKYDVSLMIERESNYFLRAFWENFLGQQAIPGVVDEFQDIASRGGAIPADYFLHRDFQSRNIMICEGKVRFIDFQGGRKGPLGYDIASLMIDPYVGLSPEKQDDLLGIYLHRLNRHVSVSEAEFLSGYNVLAVQRNLQIIGAFAFLYQVRGKSFFSHFLHPALVSLDQRLTKPSFANYPYLRKMVQDSLRMIRNKV